MQLIYEPDSRRIAAAVGRRLSQALAGGQRLAWFVCGGSNIPLVVQAMAMVPAGQTGRLTVLLTDERYGVPGHADSNWRQLDDAGFDPRGARVVRTLLPEATLQDTVQAYDKAVREVLANADLAIAQFGVGGDGHIAGILPQSDASRIAADDQAAPLVVGYDGGAYQRITITPPVWRHIGVAYACAMGDTKREALRRLAGQVIAVPDQPAQLLKLLPEAYLYTDQQINEEN